MKHHVNHYKSLTHPDIWESWCLNALNFASSAVRIAIDAQDDLGKGSAGCKGRRASTSVSLRLHAIPACHSRRESLSTVA